MRVLSYSAFSASVTTCSIAQLWLQTTVAYKGPFLPKFLNILITEWKTFFKCSCACSAASLVTEKSFGDLCKAGPERGCELQHMETRLGQRSLSASAVCAGSFRHVSAHSESPSSLQRQILELLQCWAAKNQVRKFSLGLICRVRHPTNSPETILVMNFLHGNFRDSSRKHNSSVLALIHPVSPKLSKLMRS